MASVTPPDTLHIKMDSTALADRKMWNCDFIGSESRRPKEKRGKKGKRKMPT